MENNREENSTMFALQTVITITIVITVIARLIKTHLRKLTRIIRKTVQTTMENSHNTCTQNIRDFYKTTALVISIATSMMNRTNHSKMSSENDNNNHNNEDFQKPKDEHNYPYQSHPLRSSGNNNN